MTSVFNILRMIGLVVIMAVTLSVLLAIICTSALIGASLAYACTGDDGAGIIGGVTGGLIGLVYVWRLMRDTPGPRVRGTIPLNVRAAVIARDGFACRHCGCTDVQTFQIDHVVPWSRGGTDTVENLQTLCATCNRSKGNRYVG